MQPKSGVVSATCFPEDAHDIFGSDSLNPRRVKEGVKEKGKLDGAAQIIAEYAGVQERREFFHFLNKEGNFLNPLFGMRRTSWNSGSKR